MRTHPFGVRLNPALPAIKQRVTQTDDAVEMLEALLRKGKRAARKQTQARILLKAAAGCKDAAIMEALAVTATMIYKTRQRCSATAFAIW